MTAIVAPADTPTAAFTVTILISLVSLLLLETALLSLTFVVLLRSGSRGLDVQVQVAVVEVGRLSAIDRVDEPAGERRLVEESVIGTEEVVSVTDGAVVVDLLVTDSSTSETRVHEVKDRGERKGGKKKKRAERLGVSGSLSCG